ncbi:MAG: DNA polymerase III subunit gamma/tau, partial [Gemmatimonadetes bacterium]|nr:DNA polymerase III subunit gamma/tau [Gemmatimonadota bacterium]
MHGFFFHRWGVRVVSYLVLARKWRPQSFADLVGQEHVARTLANAIDQDRVAHAYLFAGPRGVGKTTSARILSMCLNCEKGPTAKPCGKCEVCVDIQSGRSLDVIEIDGASNRGIDEIRDLRESVRYMASSGKRKVYIIDEVHMLTTEAFNALLKTLEEPPAHVVFVFATTRATKVPATILSRTIRFEFRRITTEDIVKRLQTVLNGEGMKADRKALHLVARAADGGMRDALSLLEQVRSYGGDKLEAAQVEEALGLVDEELLFAVSNAARDADIPGVMDAIQALVDNGGDPGDFLLALEEHFRHLLVGRVSKDPGRLIESTNETIERYKEEAKAFDPDDLVRMLSLLGEGGRDLRNSPRPRLVLEMLLLRLVRMESTVSIGKLLHQLERAGASSPASAGASSPASAGASSDTNFSPEKPGAPAASPAPKAGRARGAKDAAGPVAKPVKKTKPKPGPEETVSDAPQAERLLATPAEPKREIATPVPQPEPAAPAPKGRAKAPAGQAKKDAIDGRWPDFLGHLSTDNPMIASLLHGSIAHERSGDIVEILFPRDQMFQKDQVFDPANVSILEKVFESFFARKVNFKGKIGEHVGDANHLRKEKLKQDPRIDRILDMLD